MGNLERAPRCPRPNSNDLEEVLRQIKGALTVTYCTRGALEHALRDPYPYWTGLEVCHGGPLPDVVQSVQKQTVPCVNGFLNANPYCAPLVCNVSHTGVGCKTCRMGTLEVHFGMLSTRNRLKARKANHPGMIHSGAARYSIRDANHFTILSGRIGLRIREISIKCVQFNGSSQSKNQGGIEICAAIHTKIIQFSGSLPDSQGGLASLQYGTVRFKKCLQAVLDQTVELRMTPSPQENANPTISYFEST